MAKKRGMDNLSFPMDPSFCTVAQLETYLTKLIDQVDKKPGYKDNKPKMALPGKASSSAEENDCDVPEILDIPNISVEKKSPGKRKGSSKHRREKLVVERMELILRNAKLLQMLLKQRHWFETLVKESKDGIAIMDKDGLVIGVNLAMETLSGWSMSDVAGKPAHTAFPLRTVSESKKHASTHGLALYNTPKPTLLPISADPVEAVLMDRSNQAIDVEVTGLTVRDEQGQPGGWVMTLRDIRRRKETERLGKIFLSAMSHEMQTPISVIKGFAGILADPDFDLSKEVIQEKAQLILEEGNRLESLVRQILEATSIQSGGIKLKFEQVNIANMTERMIRRIQPQAAEKGLTFAAAIGDNMPLVWADPGKLEQVFTNLLVNAVKHGSKSERSQTTSATPHKGIITVEAKAMGSSIFISVTDQGQGVAVEDKERIFGLFQRGSEVKVRGSGLGLFISKAIVEAHGGHIGVTTGSQGGACFYFTLPKEQL